MWCLGCVYLEFIAWLIQGIEAVHEFSDYRVEIQSAEIDDFFHRKVGDTVVVQQGVTDWVRALKQQYTMLSSSFGPSRADHVETNYNRTPQGLPMNMNMNIGAFLYSYSRILAIILFIHFMFTISCA